MVAAAPLTVNAFGSGFRAAFHVLALGLGLVALSDPRRVALLFDAQARKWLLPLLALWIYLLARAPASLDRPAALLQVLDYSALVVVMVILASGMLGHANRWVAIAGVGGMAVIAGWGIAQRFGIHPFLDPSIWEPSRPTRPLGTHNLMGGYLAAWVPVAAAGALEAGGWRRAAWSGAALLGLACFLLSESRGAWLAAGVAAIIFVPWLASGGARRIAAVARRDPAGFRLLAVAGLAVVVASAGTVVSRLATHERSGVLASQTEGAGRSGAGDATRGSDASPGTGPAPSALTSFERRALIGQTALDLVRSRPLWGRGPGSFRLAFYSAAPPAMQRLETETGETAVHAHWDALELAAELGLVGFVLAAVWLLAVASIAFRTLRSADVGLMEVGTIAGGLALGVHALVDFSLHEVPTALTGAVLVGLMIGGSSRPSPIMNRKDWRPTFTLTLVQAVAMAALVAGIAGAFAVAFAESAHRRAYDVLRTGDLEGSEAGLMRSIRLGPDRARDWVALAEVAGHRARLAETTEDRRTALAQAAERFEMAARLEPQIARRWIRAADASELARTAGVTVPPEDIAGKLERARAANPYEVQAQARLAALARMRGDLDRAAEELAAAEKWAPGDPRIQVERGRLALAQGDQRAAVTAFAAAAEHGPAVAGGAFDGLAALAATGTTHGGTARGGTARGGTPRGGTAHGGTTHGGTPDGGATTGAQEAREALLELANARGPGAAEAARRLADLALWAADQEEAKRWYDHAVALSAAQGPSAELELGLGNLAYASGAFAEAERHYRAALTARPDMAEAIQNLGNLAVARGDTATGRRFYGRALILQPDNASLRAYMARLGGPR